MCTWWWWRWHAGRTQHPASGRRNGLWHPGRWTWRKATRWRSVACGSDFVQTRFDLDKQVETKALPSSQESRYTSNGLSKTLNRIEHFNRTISSATFSKVLHQSLTSLLPSEANLKKKEENLNNLISVKYFLRESASPVGAPQAGGGGWKPMGGRCCWKPIAGGKAMGGAGAGATASGIDTSGASLGVSSGRSPRSRRASRFSRFTWRFTSRCRWATSICNGIQKSEIIVRPLEKATPSDRLNQVLNKTKPHLTKKS